MPNAPSKRALLALALAANACSSIPSGRSAIVSVSVSHLKSISPGDVEEKLATAASPKFLGLLRGVVYDYEVFDETTLQRDLARVERYLHGKGFLEARARAGRVLRINKNLVRVEIVVDQGGPTLNRRAEVQGVEALPPDDQARVSAAATKALVPGRRFDEAAFKKSDDAVRKALTEHGYAYAKVTSTGQIDLSSHAADYTIKVEPGPIATFGAISIIGLDPDGAGPRPQEIPEFAVRRAINIKAGSTFSSAKVDAATQALLDLGVFSAVEVVPSLSDPPTPVVNLAVRLEPTRLRELKLGGGAEFDVFKTELDLLASWENHNFLGGLRDFTIDAKPGIVLYPTRVDNLTKPTNPLLTERLKMELRQPGFLEAHATGFIRPEFNIFPLLVAPDPPTSDPVVGFLESKTAIGVERTFFQHLYVSLGYTVQVEVPIAYVQALNPELGVIVLAYPQLVTNLDFRDSAVHPHAGVYLGNNLAVAEGFSSGDAKDVKVQPEVRTYVPLGKRLTFASRGSLGFLFNFNYARDWANELKSSATNPASGLQGDIERMFFRGFFSGGPNTNRGFPLFGVSPYGVVPFLNPATANSQLAKNCLPTAAGYDAAQCFIPVGGSTLWELSNELRVQVSGPFAVSGFCDMGDVSPNIADIRLDHLHLSCGAGFRYDTPVGPIRLDLGYRIQPLQVVGFKNETAAANSNPVNGLPATIFGAPIALSFGIGEAF